MTKGGFVKRYMTIPEVAAYFSLSKSYIYELIQNGKLKAWHPDKAVGSRGLRVTMESVTVFERQGMIDTDEYAE